MSSEKIAYIRTTVREFKEGGRIEPVWVTPPTGEGKDAKPGKPLIQLTGPFPLEIAENFMRARAEHNLHSPSTWELLDEKQAETCEYTSFTKNLM